MPDLNRLLVLSDFEKLALIESLRTAAHAYRQEPDSFHYIQNAAVVNSFIHGDLADRLADRLETASGVFLS